MYYLIYMFRHQVNARNGSVWANRPNDDLTEHSG